MYESAYQRSASSKPNTLKLKISGLIFGNSIMTLYSVARSIAIFRRYMVAHFIWQYYIDAILLTGRER